MHVMLSAPNKIMQHVVQSARHILRRAFESFDAVHTNIAGMLNLYRKWISATFIYQPDTFMHYTSIFSV